MTEDTIPTKRPDAAPTSPRPKIEAAYRVRLTIEWNHPVDDSADDGLGVAKHEIDRIMAALAHHTGLRVTQSKRLARVRGLGPQPAPQHPLVSTAVMPADADFAEVEEARPGTPTYVDDMAEKRPTSQ